MKQHWLYSPGARRKLWIGGMAILLLTVLVELFIPVHSHFRIAAWFASHAVFGFLTCVAMILFAGLLGFFIKRRDDYYDR